MINLKLIVSRQNDLNISDGVMAKKLGFSDRSTWYKYKTGAYSIKAEMLPTLSKELNIKYSDFFAQNSSKVEQSIRSKEVSV